LLIGANVLTFLLIFSGVPVAENLAFDPIGLLSRPWIILTYSLVATDIVTLLLSSYILWLFGGSLERSWGGPDYVVFLVLTIAAPAISVWIGMLLTGLSVPLVGLWLPVAAATVAWATINPHERLLLYFVVPIEARWLGLVAAAVVFFSSRFPVGFFKLAGCGVAWWYARGGKYRLWALRRGELGGGRPQGRERSVTFNPLDAFQRWRRKRQFMRLIKRSGFRDHDS